MWPPYYSHSAIEQKNHSSLGQSQANSVAVPATVHSTLDSVAVAQTNEIECSTRSIAFVVSEVDSVVFVVAEFGCPEKIAAAAV